MLALRFAETRVHAVEAVNRGDSAGAEWLIKVEHRSAGEAEQALDGHEPWLCAGVCAKQVTLP